MSVCVRVSFALSSTHEVGDLSRVVLEGSVLNQARLSLPNEALAASDVLRYADGCAELTLLEVAVAERNRLVVAEMCQT